MYITKETVSNITGVRGKVNVFTLEQAMKA
jgi:hypothetical protein